MALKAKKGNQVLISTQNQFLYQVCAKKSGTFIKEWNGLAKHEKMSCKSFEAEEEKAERGGDRKNRYKAIECIDNERVVVGGSGYIHANYIKSSDEKKLFIATQGPTVATAKDFWKMVLQERVKVIVMLCEVFEEAEENGKKCMKEKCVGYWPTKDDEFFDYVEFEVHHMETAEKIYGAGKKREAIATTQLEIIDAASRESHIVQHVHHRTWPDLSVPEMAKPVIEIYQKYVTPSVNSEHPVIVHCSAGIGRTGCFIAAYYCFDSFKKSQLVAIDKSVKLLRRMRGRAVQKATQYLFLHVLLLEMIESEFGKDLKKPKNMFRYMIKVFKEKEAKKKTVTEE